MFVQKCKLQKTKMKENTDWEFLIWLLKWHMMMMLKRVWFRVNAKMMAIRGQILLRISLNLEQEREKAIWSMLKKKLNSKRKKMKKSLRMTLWCLLKGKTRKGKLTGLLCSKMILKLFRKWVISNLLKKWKSLTRRREDSLLDLKEVPYRKATFHIQKEVIFKLELV